MSRVSCRFSLRAYRALTAAAVLYMCWSASASSCRRPRMQPKNELDLLATSRSSRSSTTPCSSSRIRRLERGMTRGLMVDNNGQGEYRVQGQQSDRVC